jgi:hypothetical protein
MKSYRISLFAVLCAALAVSPWPEARTQTMAPDFLFTDFSQLGGPSPSGRFRATFQFQNGTATVTADVVVYRGSLALGGAREILKTPLTFGPGAFVAYDSGPSVAIADGDIFTVCINPNHTIAESNYNNNCQETVVSDKFTDVSLGVADIAISPVGPAVGQPMNVNATVRSKQPVAARVLVRLFQSHPYSAGAKLLGQNTINVPGNGSAVASFTTTRPAGDSNLWFQLADVYPRDIAQSDNIASRNVFLKAIVNTGRAAYPGLPYASQPAVGELLGTGQPVMVFAEYVAAGSLNSEARITAMQMFPDGTYKELWSKSGFLPPAADAIAPAIADIDGDGQPEIIFEAVHRDPSGAGGQMGVFVLNKDGSLKWQHLWNTVGRVPCHNYVTESRPAIGDMNGDGIADIVILESDFVVLDGKSGNELVRKPFNLPGVGCSSRAYSVIADVDGDGKPEYIAAEAGLHVFRRDGTILWENPTLNMDAFALVDVDKDGKPEIVVPVFRGPFVILDAATGREKMRKSPSPDWTAWSWSIAATTSLDPGGFPSFAIANNDFANGTGLLDNNLNLKWYDTVPLEKPRLFG